MYFFYPRHFLQGGSQAIIGVVEFPVSCSMEREHKCFLMILRSVFYSSVHVCVLLQHLDLALQNVSFIGELLHELLVSAADRSQRKTVNNTRPAAANLALTHPCVTPVDQPLLKSGGAEPTAHGR